MKLTEQQLAIASEIIQENNNKKELWIKLINRGINHENDHKNVVDSYSAGYTGMAVRDINSTRESSR